MMLSSGKLVGADWVVNDKALPFQKLLAAHNTYIRASSFYAMPKLGSIDGVAFSFEELSMVVEENISKVYELGKK